MAAQPPADTRMMGIVHAAFHRDLARLRVMLTAAPAPGGGQRKALAGQVLWLMEMLHTHHQGEDDGLWPLVRERDPAADGLLDEMVAEHHAIVPAIGALTGAARRYGSDGGDSSRVELVQALDSLTAVLVPHMDREVAEAMPVVGTGPHRARLGRLEPEVQRQAEVAAATWAGRALAARRDRPGRSPVRDAPGAGGAAVHHAARVRPALPAPHRLMVGPGHARW